MLTEVWPSDYVPDWPPRWSAGEQPRPLVVYLDQWCFAGRFVRDRAGMLDDRDAGSYQFLRSLALDGSVIFPLSEAHYRESWKRDNADAMWDTAVVMAELSGFHTVNFRGLAEWEALKAVATYTETVVEIPIPEPIGWGMSYCFSGREVGAQIIDQSTGRPVRWGDLTQHAKQAAHDLGQSASYLFELAMLARRVPPGWQVDIPPVPPLVDGKGAAFLAQEQKIRAALDTDRSPKRIRTLVELLSYMDSLEYLAWAAQRLGLDVDVIDPGDDPAALHALVGAMQIQSIFTELRVQTHLKPNWKGSTSDVLDFLPIATVAPFADYYVADKKTYNLAVEAGLDQVSGCRIVHRLSELCDLLQQRLA